MLRHSFASHVLQSSGDLRAVQELLGHANIATTQVYTKLDFGHLSKVYDAAHPRARRKTSKAGAEYDLLIAETCDRGRHPKSRMNMVEIAIPYGAYWSTPFARWQGSLAHLHSLTFAAHGSRRTRFKRRRSIRRFSITRCSA